MDYVRKLGKTDKEVLPWKELRLKMHEDGEATGLDDLEEEECGRLAKELFWAIHLTTSDEAKLIVKSVEEGDGFMAWGKLDAKYSQKTMSRVMRMQQECMYPKVAKVEDLVAAVLAWESKWKRMEREQEKDIKIPKIWKMSAMLKLCPKEIVDMVELRWDEIGEEYERLKDRVIGWATTKAEKRGGPVPMDVGEIGDHYEDENGDWWEIDYVYPGTSVTTAARTDTWRESARLRARAKEEEEKERVIGWATTKAEKRGGPVPMDVGEIGDHYEDENGDWWEIDYVYPGTSVTTAARTDTWRESARLRARAKEEEEKERRKVKGKEEAKARRRAKERGPEREEPRKAREKDTKVCAGIAERSGTSRTSARRGYRTWRRTRRRRRRRRRRSRTAGACGR